MLDEFRWFRFAVTRSYSNQFCLSIRLLLWVITSYKSWLLAHFQLQLVTRWLSESRRLNPCCNRWRLTSLTSFKLAIVGGSVGTYELYVLERDFFGIVHPWRSTPAWVIWTHSRLQLLLCILVSWCHVVHSFSLVVLAHELVSIVADTLSGIASDCCRVRTAFAAVVWHLIPLQVGLMLTLTAYVLRIWPRITVISIIWRSISIADDLSCWLIIYGKLLLRTRWDRVADLIRCWCSCWE